MLVARKAPGDVISQRSRSSGNRKLMREPHLGLGVLETASRGIRRRKAVERNRILVRRERDCALPFLNCRGRVADLRVFGRREGP